MAVIDPMTGQESYNEASMGAGLAIDTMQGYGVDSPLAFRMMEHLPGFAVAAGFTTARATNTIMRGGFLDNPKRFAKSRSAKYRIFNETGLSGMNEKQFVGGGRSGIFGRRAAAKVASGEATTFLAKSARVNTLTMRPRALTRYHSLSIMSQGGGYTPFAAAGIITGRPSVQKYLAEKTGLAAGTKDLTMHGGLAASIGAMGKINRLETKVANRLAKDKKISSRMGKKLADVDRSIFQLGSVNNVAGGAKIEAMAKTFTSATDVGVRGARGNALASVLPGKVTQFYGGYFQGASGFANVGFASEAAAKGATAAETRFAGAASRALGMSEAEGRALLQKSAGKNIFKELGMSGVKKVAAEGGGRVLAMRALGMAIPGVNVAMTALLVKDLAKMGGELIKSGINLAKDSVVSIKGSINKPLFGMGYRDTEAAATSRARGVMAIQNSRLNARSMLGSEAGMLAAHFG